MYFSRYARGECKSGKQLNLWAFAFSLTSLFPLYSFLRKHIKTRGGQKEFISGSGNGLEGKYQVSVK